MAARAYVLISGGIDSATCLFLARAEFEFSDVLGISIDYGQRHRREIAAAAALCQAVGAGHEVLDLSGIVPRTMLTDPDAPVPNVSYAEITGRSPAYVPFRNGLMLSAVSSYAAGQQEVDDRSESAIYFGAHAEDAQNYAYADCTPEFTGAMANAICVGSYSRLRLHTPLQWLDKEGVIRLGERLGVPWAMTWSCYKGEERHCGVCPTCRARRSGFARAQIADPTQYAA